MALRSQSRHRSRRIMCRDQSTPSTWPFDEEVPVEDQHYAADDSPIALSLGYIADLDPNDEGRGGALAPTDSIVVVSLIVDPVPSAEETEPFETDESEMTPPPPPLAYRTTTRLSIRAQAPIPFPFEAEVDILFAIPTPPPSPFTPLSSPLPQIPSPPFPVPSPPATSPTYAEASLGVRAARIRLRAASPLPLLTLPPPTHYPLPLPAPSTSCRADILEVDIPPQKRLYLTAPTSRFEVRESSTADAARHPSLRDARTTDYGFVDMVDDAPRFHVPREVEYGITDTWYVLVDAIQEGALTTL
nr:hypothetical protein [Tanacetum cinerariifolium]